MDLYCKIASLRERATVIQVLEEKTCYFCLLRDFHILQLFRDCTESRTGCLNRTQWQPPHNDGRLGNLIHLEESDITRSMMQQIFPELEEGSCAYNSSYNKLKLWRGKGKRLDPLVTKFSIGILV